MKGLFINLESFKDEKDLITSGVHKKVCGQISVLSKHFEMKHYLANHYNYCKARNIFDFIRVRLPWTGSMYSWKFKEEFLDTDFIYFRKPVIDGTVVRLLKKIKQKKPGIRILFAIPTYPYDKEWNGWKKFPFIMKDKYYRRKLKKCVDRVVVIGEGHEKIFGIPAINIKNGIDFNTIPCNPINTTNDINMISVSSYNERHGWDRIIEGMIDYYKNNGKREMTLHLVGPGVPASLINKVNNSIIKDRVIFYGSKGGKDLDEIYSKCNLALDTIALHRIHLENCSSLKSREYSARGIPFISCSIVDYLPKDSKFYLKVNSNESNLDMKVVIDYFDEVYSNENIRNEIREYAFTTCDMSITMRPVVDYLLECNKSK